MKYNLYDFGEACKLRRSITYNVLWMWCWINSRVEDSRKRVNDTFKVELKIVNEWEIDVIYLNLENIRTSYVNLSLDDRENQQYISIIY